MSNLFNLGRSGLNAAQAGLNTAGHNIANVNTPGYSRQQALISTAGGQGGSSGYFGRGVQVDAVRRIYDGFLTGQLNTATTIGASLSTYTDQIGQINNLLADRTVGLSPALTKFFEGVNAVASQPADPAARQELIGRANSLASQFTTANRFLQDQREAVNRQLGTTVTQINSYAERINDLNKQIVNARATVHGQAPNDLLDQRDQLVAELNELVQVNVVEQGDSFNLSVGNGQTLLAGTKVYPLQAVQSAADPGRIAVAYTTPDGTVVELADDVLDGGSLGGLLRFRTEALDPAQNELGRLAIGTALAFNQQHVQGRDLGGAPGEAFFSFLNPVPAMANGGNAGDATFSMEFTDASALTLTDYHVKFESGAYTVTRLSDNSVAYTGTTLAGAEFDGIRLVDEQGTAHEGDTFLLQPTRNGAGHIGVAITDPAKIAASSADPDSAGTANGDNALELAKLQTAKTLGGGSMSLVEAFSQLVNGVGVKTQAAITARTAQESLIAQNFEAQQAVSGVNLNEEYINLDFYVQQYNASARLIEVGTTLFDTLLGLRA